MFRKKSSWLSLALHLGDYSFGGGGLKKQKILGIVMIYCKKWYNKAKLNVLGENMNFIQEKQIEINLGLSGRYTLMQFNDVHLATFDRDKDDLGTINRAISQERIWMSQRIDFARKFNEHFASDTLLSSAECLERLIDYAIKNRPDLVIMAGDIVDYYSKSNWDFLVQAVSRLESPYLFSCGNHESPADFFKDLCQGNSYFQVADLGELLVVSVNNSVRKIGHSQLESFQKLLSQNMPLVLVMHVPMMTRYNKREFERLDAYFTMSYDDGDATTKEFMDLVAESEKVKAVLCGHTHGAIFSFIAPGKPQYCCSSGLIGSVNKIIIK